MFIYLCVLTGEDQDLRLAIELSLQEAASKSPAPDSESKPTPTSSGVTPSRTDNPILPYSPDYSTIVTRVPNKSVEDLAAHNRSSRASDSGIINTNEYLGAYGGITMEANLNRCLPCDSGLSNRRSKSYNHIVSQRTAEPPADCPKSRQPTAPNSFGLIKDIAVGNIVAADVDKTKNFADKDFSQVFYKKSFPCEMNYDGQRGDADRHEVNADKSGAALEDPWLRQVPICPPPSGRPHSTGWSLPPGPPQQSHHGRLFSDSACHDRPCVSQRYTDISHPADPREAEVEESRPLLGHQDSVDPADIVISSEVLESLLQGAERYTNISDEELELPLPPPPPPPAGRNVEDMAVIDLNPDSHPLVGSGDIGDNQRPGEAAASGANRPQTHTNSLTDNTDDTHDPHRRPSSSEKDAVFV